MKVESFRRKNIQLFATLMATATYAAGFNPPGGVWQDSAGHLPGDPMMRSTNHHRYMVFFYFNAAAFALSLMVVVVTLILAACPKKSGSRLNLPLVLLMFAATVAFMVAYGMGACRDKFGVVVYSVMVALVVPGGLLQLNLLSPDVVDLTEGEKYRGKLVAPLAMFALTISYVGGLSTPGGFLDSSEGGRRPGDSILHGKILHLFYYFNTAQFVSSLHGVFLVMCSGVHVKLAAFNMSSGVLNLIVAYTVGSSRGRRATVGAICGLCAGIVAYTVIYVAVRAHVASLFKKLGELLSCFYKKLVVRFWRANSNNEDGSRAREEDDVTGDDSLVQLLAGLAVSITYQAGMFPPGGVWQNGDKAGDPILQTTNPGRYKAFYYCNSVAFVASLVAILLGQKRYKYLTKHNALQAAMILDLLALIVAYAIGSCRDQISSLYVLGIAAAAVVYVVIHVQYFTLGSGAGTCTCKDRDDATVDKNGGRFMLFAILVASITYQAGLTPPGGFLLQDYVAGGQHHVGDPVLLYNYPRRYKYFFYCNAMSFMVSTVLLLLLVNPNMYRPAIRSHALSLCSAVSFACLIGAFAAGSSQHLKTSIGIFVLAAVAIFLCMPLLLTIARSFLPSHNSQVQMEEGQQSDDASQAQMKEEKQGEDASQLAMAEEIPCEDATQVQMDEEKQGDDASQAQLKEEKQGGDASQVQVKEEKQGDNASQAQMMEERPRDNAPQAQMKEEKQGDDASQAEMEEGKPSDDAAKAQMKKEKQRARNNIYLMTVGILVGSVTYQSGLDPPGGSWQSGSHAGHPVMRDQRRNRYLAFLCGNSTSFVASIYLIEVLLFNMAFSTGKGLKRAIVEPIVVAQYLGFLIAYAAGSSRQWKTSAHVVTLVIAVLAYVAIHVVLTFCIQKTNKPTKKLTRSNLNITSSIVGV